MFLTCCVSQVLPGGRHSVLQTLLYYTTVIAQEVKVRFGGKEKEYGRVLPCWQRRREGFCLSSLSLCQTGAGRGSLERSWVRERGGETTCGWWAGYCRGAKDSVKEVTLQYTAEWQCLDGRHIRRPPHVTWLAWWRNTAPHTHASIKTSTDTEGVKVPKSNATSNSTSKHNEHFPSILDWNLEGCSIKTHSQVLWHKTKNNPYIMPPLSPSLL